MRCHEEVPEVVLQYALNSKLSTMKLYGNEKGMYSAGQKYVNLTNVHPMQNKRALEVTFKLPLSSAVALCYCTFRPSDIVWGYQA